MQAPRITGARSPLLAAPAHERRRGYRQPVRTGALLWVPETMSAAFPAPAGEPIPVHVFEVSMSGVGFSAAVPLEVGRSFDLDLCMPQQGRRRCEIRSCRRRHDAMFDIGARFV